MISKHFSGRSIVIALIALLATTGMVHGASPSTLRPEHGTRPAVPEKLLTSYALTLTASDADENGQFGSGVAVDGNTAVIGAAGAYWGYGAAYVLKRNNEGADSWGEAKILTATDLSTNFGDSVAICGDTIVVGDPLNSTGGETWRGAVYVFERNQDGADNWGQVAKIVPADAAEYDNFGFSVSISGDTIVVGSLNDDDNGGSSGSAYVFQRNQGGANVWGQVAKLTPIDNDGYDYFGCSVAIDDDTIVVGAREEDEAGNSSGAAYIFERNKNGADLWGEVTKLTASDATSNERFGYSVAIDGSTVAVGARLGRVNVSPVGAAYVYERNQGGADNWGEVAKLIATDAEQWDEFGWAIAIDCDTVVVGARLSDDDGDTSGSAYVFERNKGGADSWGQTAKLTAPVAAAYDWFGHSVAIDGETVLVGGNGSDVAGYDAAGAAWLYTRGGGTWLKRAKRTGSSVDSFDYFGTSLSVSGDMILIGSEREEDDGYNAGAAYLFERNSGGQDNWGEIVRLTASDAGTYKYFGKSASLSGDTAVVGSNLSSFGGAYVFERNKDGANAWGEVTKLTPHDGSTDKKYGRVVAIDGDTAVVGAYGDSEKGASAGAVYIFSRNQGGADNWGEVAKLTASDFAEGDYFGWSVAINGDLIAVGAVGNSDAGSFSGSAYLFRPLEDAFGDIVWTQVAKLTASDATSNNWFGGEIAVSGDTVAVTAGMNLGSGSVYLFERNEGGIDNWGQTHKILGSDISASARRFGEGLSMKCDKLLAGAWATNSQTGSAFLLGRNQGGADNWGLIKTFLPGDLDTMDNFGSAVGLDCNNVAISAYTNDAVGTSSGAAYIYQLDGPCDQAMTLVADQWHLISLPCAPDASIDELFGDDGLGVYGTDWAIIERVEASDSYRQMVATDTLLQGAGYWIKVLTADPGIHVAGDPTDDSSDFEVSMVSQADPGRWNLIGNPFTRDIAWADVKVVDGTSVYPLSDSTAGDYITGRAMYLWNGSSYQSIHPVSNPGNLSTFDGFWVRAKADASLRIPAPFAKKPTRGPNQSNIQGWWVQLIVSSQEYTDPGNRFGRLDVASDGLDEYDLEELQPFAAPYLTLVFPHPEWQSEAWSYTTDFREYRPQAGGAWDFEITSDSARQVTLSWFGEGPEFESLLSRSQLTDLTTGTIIAPTIEGSYPITMTGTSHLMRWRVNTIPELPLGISFEGRVDITLRVQLPFTDEDANDTHSATFDWGDGVSGDGEIDETDLSVSAVHTYTTPGNYDVEVCLDDSYGGTACEMYPALIVDDPTLLFADGFERGDALSWSLSQD